MTRVESVVAEFGPYRVQELLGRGGMGVVHRAHDTVHGRTVALKRLSPAAVDDGYRARFRRECRLAAGLAHPHVVPVHAFGEIDGQLYLDMLLVDGTDLRREIGVDGLDPARAVALLHQVAQALDAAHAAGLVHRDVKPSNILIDRTGHAYLADFGIARETDADATVLTESGLVLGTWDYLAPERLSGGPVDGRADQYALACVLFECLTGRLPHPVADPAAKVAGHLLQPAPAPSLFVPTIGPTLDAVVLRGMAKDPARRFPTATAMLDAAGQALARGAVTAPAATPVGARDRGRLVRAVIRSAAARRPTVVPPDDGPPPCPYPGLRSFEADDAAWFHGRDHVVTDLVVRLAEQLDGGDPVVLVGASGAGKSSVLRAGLLPVLADADAAEDVAWPQVLCTPGTDPVGALAAALAPLAGTDPGAVADVVRGCPAGFGAWWADARGPGGARAVLVVDQFEELFTADVPEADRLAVATALAAASPMLVLLAVRGDLLQRCIELPALLPALAAPVLLGPMSADELRRAIVAPARDAGIDVEPGLPERLVADLGARGEAGYDPAALPRLAHALRETWNQGDGTALTLAAYRRAGGVDGAVARTAEQVFAALDDHGRQVARRLLLRLVAVSEDGVVGRRPADPAVLAAVDGGAGVLDRLIAARLVTADVSGTRLAHEALLTAWPRLRDWVAADRAALLARHRFAEAAQVWAASGRQPDDLYRGARLAAVNAWREAAGDDPLPPAEQEFLDRSNAADRADLDRARRRTRRLRALVAALTVLLLVAVGAVVVADQQRGAAVTAGQLSLSRQEAAAAALAADVDPRRAALLALAAWQAAPTVEARSALLTTALEPYRGTLAASDRGKVTAVALSGDGRVAASGAEDGTLRLWDVATRRELGRLGEPAGWYNAVSMSADGRLLVAAEQGGPSVTLWSVPERRVLFRPAEPALDGAVAPDGRTFAVVDRAGQVVVRDTTSFAELSRFPSGLSVRTVYSPDGTLLATTDRTQVHLTRVADGTRVTTLTGHTGTVSSVAFDRLGARVVTTATDGTIRIWDTATGTEVRSLTSPEGFSMTAAFRQDDRVVTGDAGSGIVSWDATTGVALGRSMGPGRGTTHVAVSGDGHTVVSADGDGGATVWDIGRRTLSLSDQAVTRVAPQPHGPLLAAVAGDGSAWLWDRSGSGALRRLAGPDAGLADVAFSPDGTRLATASDAALVLWDPASGAPVGRFAAPPGTALTHVAFAPDGATLAVTGRSDADGGALLLVDRATLALRGARPLGPPGPDPAGDSTAAGLAFSPDGRLVAVPLFGGRVDLLAADPADLTDLTAPPRSVAGHANQATDAQFSPDGTTLATSGADRAVRLWRVSDGSPLGSIEAASVVRALAFSPDGSVLAAASRDTVLRLWDVRTRQPLVVADRHAQDLNSVAFADDGRLVSAAADGLALVWDLDTDDAAAALCGMLDPATVADQWRQLGPDQGEPPRCPA